MHVHEHKHNHVHSNYAGTLTNLCVDGITNSLHTYHGTLSIASTFITVSIILSAIYIMRVFLVYGHVTSVEGRDLYTRILCNRLFRYNTRVLDELDLAQTPLSITISLMSSEITLLAKDVTTLTVENQLRQLRKLITAKLLMMSQISRSTKILPQSQAKESKSTV